MSHTMRMRMASGDLLEFPIKAENLSKTDEECAEDFFSNFDWAIHTLIIDSIIVRMKHVESIDFIGGPQG